MKYIIKPIYIFLVTLTIAISTSGRWGAVAQGSFIVGDSRLEADPNNALFQHEYGHYLQSQEMGFAYYSRIGIPSIRSENGDFALYYSRHDFHPAEQDANRRGFLYFNEHVEGFRNDVLHDDDLGWNFIFNPFSSVVGVQIFTEDLGQYNYVNYNNINQRNTLDRIRVHAEASDYFFTLFGGWRGMLFNGLNNADLYNNSPGYYSN